VHGYGAVHAEHDLVVVLVVTDAANRTARIVLGNLSPLFEAILYFLLQFHSLGVAIDRAFRLLNFVHLVHDAPVPHVVPPLLREFQLLQEVVLQLARIVDVEHEPADVLAIPLPVLDHVLHEVRIHVSEELGAILVHLLGDVESVVLEFGMLFGHLNCFDELIAHSLVHAFQSVMVPLLYA
jgi:hypothetical protein